jgi:hypothetical protein
MINWIERERAAACTGIKGNKERTVRIVDLRNGNRTRSIGDPIQESQTLRRH